MDPFARTWLVRPRPQPDAAMRLFCLPYAGGGATVFRPWTTLLPDDVEMAAVQLPGREARLKEKPFTRMQALVPALADAIAPELDRPFALFGHSMGGLVAFELARELERRGVSPVRLFASGHAAPHLPDTEPRVHDLPEDAFRERLRTLQGTPEEVLAHEELMRVLVPLLRADFELCETYSFRPSAALRCPITAIGGVDDRLATRAQLDAWREHTTAAFSLRLLPGGHFFLTSDPALVVRAVMADLLPALRP